MDFSKIVLEYLQPLFVKYDLKIVEQNTNYLKLICDTLVVGISNNNFERSNTLWIGDTNSREYPIEIDNQVLKEVFNSDLELSQIPTETFIKNLLTFFDTEGRPLIMGDKKIIHDLEQFDAERSRKYTHDLIQKQNLQEADKAWSEIIIKTLLG